MRFFLVLIAVVNLLFLAWSQGALDRVIGSSSLGDRDPERLTREVRPDAVKVSVPGASRSAAGDDTACLESGPYSPAEAALAEVSLSSAISPGMWTNLRQDRPGQWVVYLGPLADKEALARKEDEVKRTKVPFESIKERGELDYGLLLGRFDSLTDANAALTRLAQQTALRNARVVNLVQPTTAHVLRVDAASSSVAQRLQQFKGDGGALKPFVGCVKG